MDTQKQSTEYESSVVIPLYNNWDMTHACLKSLAATTDKNRVQIICVDNASTDVTPKACPFLGKQLFGDSFIYARNEQNRNFAGASNQGALLASGKYLVLLNNDTEVLTGWYEPLLHDFARYPDIAATGPILLYPPQEPFGCTVQHLGVFVSPFYNIGHLYKGIPADSPLAKKRRFFQAITAACMMMPRNLFMEIGMFDEQFVNGFEDVDLCARLWEKGYKFTVNPEARVVHHESISEGRGAHEETNCEYLIGKSLYKLGPDWHLHLRNDKLVLSINNWGFWQIDVSDEIGLPLEKLAAVAPTEDLKKLLISQPYWENGWRKLIVRTEDIKIKSTLYKMFLKFYPSSENAFFAWEYAKNDADSTMLDYLKTFLEKFKTSPEDTLEIIKNNQKWCNERGIDALEEAFKQWLKNYEKFKREIYPAYRKKMEEIS